MGQRGPKPTPSAILKLRGSWRGRANAAEPQPEKGPPECPGWLTDAAKGVWEQVAGELGPTGVLTRADGNALARYCETFVQWKLAAEWIAKHGQVYPLKDKAGKPKCFVQWPQVGIYSTFGAMLAKLEAELGLTPSARSRISVPNASKPEAPSPKSRFFVA